MVEVRPIPVGEHQAIAISVQLPKTNLLMVTTKRGYIMCGALDVNLLNERLSERNIIAGRALGVRSIDQLLEAPLESVTKAAEKEGITPGMTGKEAILKMM